MKTKSHLAPTPNDLNLVEIMDRFSSDEKAREYLESIRWPKGVTCPHCQNATAARIWKIEANESKSIRAGLYQCAECDKQFTVTVGTIFEDSHIPLRKWLIAWYLMVSSKKAISALQIQRSLGFGSYRTAWLMMHKIRHALKDPVFSEPLGGVVEYDETYVGGKIRHGEKPPAKAKQGYRKNSKKVPVVALVQRDGTVRTKVIAKVSHKNVGEFVKGNVCKGAFVNTDGTPMYRSLFDGFARHDQVDHSRKEYARHNADGSCSHVNTAESFFSLLKRGIMGAWHHVSTDHLPRYCDEFAFRWDYREATDGERLLAGLQRTEGKRLTYKAPTQAKPQKKS